MEIHLLRLPLPLNAYRWQVCFGVIFIIIGRLSTSHTYSKTVIIADSPPVVSRYQFALSFPLGFIYLL